MKAILVPYAKPAECEWAQELFPNRSIAALPVCGKPLVAYNLDEISRLGVSEAMILDRHYDRRLATFIGDGSKWGMKIIYSGSDSVGDEAEIRQRNSAFIAHDELVLILGNSIMGIKIDTLKAYFDVNIILLKDQMDVVIPGYPVEKGVFIGSDVVIKPGAEIKGPVCIGDGVRVGRGVQVHPISVLGANCVIDDGARIHESVIFGGTYIGRHVEFVRKIVDGSRVIDPMTGAYVDLEDEGISESVDAPGKRVSFPASITELRQRRFTGVGDPATEKQLSEALADIARDIAALDMPKLEGVYLGGGYGRGEGGAPIYNDLDFFPLVKEVTEDDREEVQVALNALGMAYCFRLGVHVDFCRPKTRADFLRDERRIMVQEFLRGNVPVYGSSASLDFLREYPAEKLPATEALRTLVNRGMGLYLARESTDEAFINRNINKAVIGAGDAILTAEKRYRWTAKERAEELNSEDYTRAVELKFRPDGSAAVPWDIALMIWQIACGKVLNARGDELMRRTLKQGVRYIKNRHRLGRLSEFGRDPLFRIFERLSEALKEGKKLDAVTMRDWEVFN